MATPSAPGGVAFRIYQGQYVQLYANALVGSGFGAKVKATVSILYDDGTTGQLIVPQTALAANTVSVQTTTGARADGWIVGIAPRPVGSYARNSVFVELFIVADAGGSQVFECLAAGFLGNQDLILGELAGETEWALWMVQGTVISDATVGTHISTLTVSPGTGTELEFLYGQIIATGAAASAQSAVIDDGTNVITTFFSASAAGTYNFPYVSTTAAAVGPTTFRISGTSRLVLTSTTSTVSQTQTFAAAFKIRGFAMATGSAVLLADNVGTPTLTYNTNHVF